MILDLAMSMPQTKEYLNKIPEGMKSLARSFGQEDAYLMVRIKKIPSEKDPTQFVEKAVIAVMGIVNGSLTVLKNEKGELAEYTIDESAIAMIRQRIEKERESQD